MRTALAVISFILVCLSSKGQLAMDSLKTQQLDSVKTSAIRITTASTAALIYTQLAKTNPTQNLGQMLQRNAGLYIRSNGTSGLNTLSYKGLGSMHTPIVIDGANMQSSMNGMMDLSLIDAIHFDDVSIAPAVAAQNGSQNMGGALVLGSNKYLSHVKITTELSTQQEKTLALAYAIHIKKWGYKVSASATSSPNRVNLRHYGIDSFQSNTDFNKLSVLQSVSYSNEQGGLWENNIYIQASDRAIAPRLYEVNNSRQEDMNLMMTNSYAKTLPKRWEVKMSNQLWKEQINYIDDKQKESFLSEAVNINSTASVSKKWGQGAILNVVLGNENAYYNSKAIRTYAQWNRLRLASSFTKSHKKMIFSMHQQFLTNNEKVFLTGSFRTSFAYTQQKRITLVIEKVVRLPSLNELYWFQPGYALGNIDLIPEEGYKADVQAEYEIYNFSIAVNPFFGYYQNWINWSGFPEIKPENIQSVLSGGALLKVSYRKEVGRSTWAVLSNLNWTKATYFFMDKRDARHGKQLIYTPQLTSNIVLTLSRKNIGIHLNQQFVGVNYFTSDNTSHLDSYFLTEVGAYHQFKKWRVGLLVANILNTAYYTQPRTPLPGRTFKINLNYTLPFK